MAKRKSLTDAELARKSGKKKANDIIYIIPEGQTEYAYFTAIKNHFRKTNLHIEVAKANTDTDPRQIANRAILARKSNADYTHIACVLDADNPTALAEAKASVKRYKAIELYTSEPCFEVWLLLHFTATDAPFENCSAVETRLRSHWESFVKGLKCPCTQLIDKLPIAIQNHAQLASLQTEIPKLIEKTQD